MVHHTGSDGYYSPGDAYDESAYWTGTNIPTNSISWYEGSQFVNYLNTSTGHAAAYKFTGTQGTGDYTFSVWGLEDSGYDSDNPYRNSEAFYFMPTEDEWVKAAYWNGTSLQTYATKPGDTLYQGNGSNGGWNYKDDDNGPDGPSYGLWDVGSGSEELNGTFDVMGNGSEWVAPGMVRGGSWQVPYIGLASRPFNTGYTPSNESWNFTIRVASVPEPCSLVLLSLGGLMLRRKLRR